MFYGRPASGVTRRLRLPPALEQAWRHVLQWLLPSPCLGCRQTVWEPADSLGLCRRCRHRLVRWPRHGCAACGRLLEVGEPPPGYRCGRCRERPPPYDRLLSTWCYQPPLDEVLTGLKFRRLDYLGSQLGRAVARIHRDELDECGVVVPVPLYWTRHLRRGFNQAALIARPLARALERPLVAALVRRRPTPHQSRLGRRRRRQNLDQAFAVRRSGLLPHQKREIARALAAPCVLLVDDVTTTGATLEAAAACLKAAGVGRVVALTAARTPEADERPRIRRVADLLRK